MSEAPIRRRVQVRGRVQGVYFRGATREQARRLGVQGWVRNREDGGVEAVLEGPPGPVVALLAFLEHGPPAARVEALEAVEEPVEALVGFEIVR